MQKGVLESAAVLVLLTPGVPQRSPLGDESGGAVRY